LYFDQGGILMNYQTRWRFSLMKGSILFLLAFVAGESEAQPFVYCAHGNDNLTEIIRLNLRTGLQKHVKWERSPVGELTSDPAGRWLFYPLGTNFYAVNLADTVDSGSVPFCTDRARVVAILPHTGRYIIDGSGSDGDIFHQRFVIYDKTLSEVGSIVDKDVIKTDVAFPTANEGMLLFSGYDSVGGGNYIGAYEFDNRLVEWKRMLADIGPIGVPKKFVDGEKGKNPRGVSWEEEKIDGLSGLRSLRWLVVCPGDSALEGRRCTFGKRALAHRPKSGCASGSAAQYWARSRVRCHVGEAFAEGRVPSGWRCLHVYLRQPACELPRQGHGCMVQRDGDAGKGDQR
jgi:hypothetical protein